MYLHGNENGDVWNMTLGFQRVIASDMVGHLTSIIHAQRSENHLLRKEVTELKSQLEFSAKDSEAKASMNSQRKKISESSLDSTLVKDDEHDKNAHKPPVFF